MGAQVRTPTALVEAIEDRRRRPETLRDVYLVKMRNPLDCLVLPAIEQTVTSLMAWEGRPKIESHFKDFDFPLHAGENQSSGRGRPERLDALLEMVEESGGES